LAIADRLDAERQSRGPRGPLHGVPILLKDNIATADRMMTTAGSLALAGVTPPKDAFIVERLREAGAVILGKTNLSEWANFRSTHSTSGWSGRGGQTKNPYALDRNPSGSSSGSAASVAASLSAAAIGTETDGSIVSPSSNNGLVGMAEKKGPLTSAKYKAALAKNHQMSRARGIDAVMTKYTLDALVAPTGGPAWLTDLVNGDSSAASAAAPSTVTSVAGYPHITVPAGYVRGLPVGISFFGRAWSEPTLIKLAYAYEQATTHRRPPAFAPTANLRQP
jgi:Asp-tRNA(Asn)/Glu-tRNA(Gln) amidotransferase A subunit family amidase